jgi:mannosyltransferase
MTLFFRTREGTSGSSIGIPVLVGVEILLAAALAFVLLGNKNLWIDEALSVALARDWAVMWHDLHKLGGNMWFYHVLLHVWLTIGDSEFTVRSLSAIFAVATVPVCYAIGARLFDSRVGLIAALLLTVNPFFIPYAQEARGYSLLLLLTTVSSYFFVRALERPSLRNSSAYVLSSVLAVGAHYFALLVLMVHASSLAFRHMRDIPWKWVIVNGVGTALLIFVSTFPLLRGSQGHGGIGWIPEPQLRSVYDLFYVSFAGGSLGLFLFYFGSCVTAVGFGLVELHRSGLSTRTWRFAFLVTWLWAPIVVTFIFSLLWVPVFWPRYLILCLSPLVLLAAVGLAKIRNRWLLTLALAGVVFFSGLGLWSWYTGYHKRDWRGVAAFVVSGAQRGDAIIFHEDFIQIPFNYYLHRMNAPRDLFTYIDLRFGNGEPLPDSVRETLERLSDRFSRVWLVLSYHKRPRFGGGVRARLIREVLLHKYKVAEEHEFEFGPVQVLRYDRRPAKGP